MAQILDHAADAATWLAARVPPGGPGVLRIDSRQVGPGDAFIAWPGHATDGRQFVPAALAAGAAACLIEAEGAAGFDLDTADPRIALLPGLKAATGEVAAAWFGQPGRRLQVIAVTGTNGKSSTAWWTAQALTALGRRCGLVGTLGMGEPPPAAPGGEPPPAAPGGEPPPAAPGGEPPPAAPSDEPLAAAAAQGAHAVGEDAMRYTGLTTPDPVTLQAGLRHMADQGFAACAIEASSIGLVEQRLAGTPIAVAQFTNFSRDHLDFHADMADYWAAKRVLFDWPGLRAAVINIDDDQGAALADELAGRNLDLWTTSVNAPARLRAVDLGYIGGGLAFTLVEGDQVRPVRSHLIGDYNAHNLLAVLGALRALGLPLAQAAAVVPRLGAVPGRMQRVAHTAGQPEVVVDFAHTPDALDKALGALRPLAAARGGRLWCVFGCGGNRDASKRPLMGAIAQRLADQVVLTSDNPRHEAPAAILRQIRGGMADSPALRLIEDRREAIALAIEQAAAQDVLLIAGKGHETTQDVAGVLRLFSDVDVAAQALVLRGRP